MSTYNAKNYTAQGGSVWRASEASLEACKRYGFLRAGTPGAIRNAHGAESVIGGELQVYGKLTIAPGAEIIGLPEAVLAEEVTLEGLAPAQPQPDSTATSVAQLRADYNALLANLREAGVLAVDPE